jgi:hypothetical protein
MTISDAEAHVSAELDWWVELADDDVHAVPELVAAVEELLVEEARDAAEPGR